jgi:MFS family permease
MSTVSGCMISLSGHYLYVVLAGYSLWTLGCGLLLLWGKTTSDGVCIVILLIVGVGVGSTFQPTMVAAQAQANKADRAVVISTRNVLRSFGGATGIAIASTTVSNTLLKKIDEVAADPGEYGTFPASYLAHLKTQIFSKIDTADLGAAQQNVIRTIYMSSMKNYFYLLAPFMAVCLISSLFIKDRGLQCLDETPKDETISTRTSRTDYSTDIESN